MIHISWFSDSVGRTATEAHQSCVLGIQGILCCGAAIKSASLTAYMLSRCHPSFFFLIQGKCSLVCSVSSEKQTLNFPHHVHSMILLCCSFGSEFYSKLEEDRCTLRADRQRKAFAVSGIIYSLLQCFIPMVMCSVKSYLDT